MVRRDMQDLLHKLLAVIINIALKLDMCSSSTIGSLFEYIYNYILSIKFDSKSILLAVQLKKQHKVSRVLAIYI